MQPKTKPAPDGPVPFNCPKCGAPAVLPYDLSVVSLRCQFCNETFTIPNSIRDAQERSLRWLRNTAASSTNIGAVVIGLTIVGIMITAVGAYMASRNMTPVAVLPRQVSPQPEPEPSPTITVPVTVPVASPPDGEARVKALMSEYERAGCTVLLPATRIVGGRDIDAKLVANGPCVRLLAASGRGDQLELTMKTPKGRPVTTPAAATELDFLYCAKQAGLHPANIRSNAENPFTVASIECPRR
jgi:hypothetical protein